MTKVRGKYASSGLAERRQRILQETLKLLEAEHPADISMALIAEKSGVSPKTLYNLFKNRSGLLLAAAAFRRYETEHHRVGRTQEWFYEALFAAKAEGQLEIGTDITELSQLMAASQWGVTLLWQKKLISLATLRHQAAIKHCLDLIPFSRGATKEWLEDLLTTLTSRRSEASDAAWPIEARMAS